MKINGALIDDTHCEAFRMKCARLLVTAHDHRWLDEAVRSATGLATSIIGCDVEAGLETKAASTPDGRPGAYLLFFGRTLEGLGKSLLTRIGQGLMTCPTTAVFNAMDNGEPLNVGRKLAFFGDGFEELKTVHGRRMWSAPVTEGEFLVEDVFNVGDGVAGGAFIVMAENLGSALAAVTRAREAIDPVPGVILPFPGGAARCASKVGSVKYPFLKASTNTPFCPTLRGIAGSKVPDGVTCALEVVIDGVDEESVKTAMRAGIMAACEVPGVKMITSANFGGKLGDVVIQITSLAEGVQQQIERSHVNLFLEKLGITFGELESVDKPDIRAIDCQIDGKKTTIGIEHTKYYNDEISSDNNKLVSRSTLLESFTNDLKSEIDSIRNKKRVECFPECLLSFNDNLATEEIKSNDNAKLLAQEVFTLCSQHKHYMINITSNIDDINIMENLNKAEFPLIARFLNGIFVRKITSESSIECANLMAGSFGITQEKIVRKIEKKAEKAKEYNTQHIDELWLLIVASGESVSQLGSIPEFNWQNDGIQQSCKKSPFKRIYFMDVAFMDAPFNRKPELIYAE